MASWDYPAVNAPSTANYAAPLVNFAPIGDLKQDYYKNQELRRGEEKANVFRNGIPKVGGSTDPNAPIDVGAVIDKLGRINPDYAMPLISTQIAGQQGQAAASAIMGQPPASGAPQSGVPQTQRTQPSAAPQAAAPAQSTIMTVLSAQGIPNDQLQAASESVARQLGVAPTEPIDTSDPRIRNVLGPAISQLKRAGVGNVVTTASAAPDSQPPQPSPSATPNQRVAQAPTIPQPQPIAAATPDAGTQGWTQADADALSARATRLNAYGAAIANVNPKAAEMAKAEAAATEARAKQIRDYISDEDKSTPEMKNAADPNVAKFELTKEQQKNDVERFGKQYDAIAKVGDQADETMPQLDLAKRLVNDPNFVSGSLAPGSDMLKRLSVAFGLNPNTATPDQVFDKVRAGSILNQIKGMAGTGPVRVAEMKFIDQMIAGRENTPATLRTLLEIESRLYQRAQYVRDQANQYNGGHLDPKFDKQMADYKNSHALFSPAELKDPRLIAPPVFTTPQQVAAAHLPHGEPFKTPDGRIKYVP